VGRGEVGERVRERGVEEKGNEQKQEREKRKGLDEFGTARVLDLLLEGWVGGKGFEGPFCSPCV